MCSNSVAMDQVHYYDIIILHIYTGFQMRQDQIYRTNFRFISKHYNEKYLFNQPADMTKKCFPLLGVYLVLEDHMENPSYGNGAC